MIKKFVEFEANISFVGSSSNTFLTADGGGVTDAQSSTLPGFIGGVYFTSDAKDNKQGAKVERAQALLKRHERKQRHKRFIKSICFIFIKSFSKRTCFWISLYPSPYSSFFSFFFIIIKNNLILNVYVSSKSMHVCSQRPFVAARRCCCLLSTAHPQASREKCKKLIWCLG